MKKTISALLSLVLALSCILSAGEFYADDKIHIEDALIQLETQTGYIPGKTSSVTYNCFGFVSDICQKLYGVSYYYEQQDGNYKFIHTNNYFTVADTVIAYTSDLNTRKAYASQLADWIKENAAAGDILQYGSADPNYSKKHTVLIQHIDEEKMQIIHSNYETQNIPATACRVDTVYWNSFISNPTANEYDSNGSIISLNLLLGSNMKLTQGMGVSINRYSCLETKYYLDSLSKFTPVITKTERASCTSIKVYWGAVDGASAYSVEYKRAEDPDWTAASYSIAATDYTVKNLIIGSTYYFRVRAFAEGVWKNYSVEAVKSALPPKPANITAVQSDGGIALSWAARKDITGCIIYRSDSKSGAYNPITTISDNEQVSFTDSSIAANQTYYYKIQRFVYIGDTAYFSDISSAVSSKFSVNAPSGVFAWSEVKNALGVTWKAVPNAVSYTVECRQNGTSKVKYITTSALSCNVKGLKLNKKYSIKVTANSVFGASKASKCYSITLKPKTPSVSAKKSKSYNKISWKKQSGVSGYYIYRSYSKNGKYVLIKTVKGAKTVSFTDKNAGKRACYYKVKSYVKSGKTIYKSNSSSAVKAKK